MNWFDRLIRAAFLATISTLLLTAHAAADMIFLGPTPYLSAADSPFDLSGLGDTFFLEDFEDGELNTPGVSILPLYPGTRYETPTARVRGPGEDTDSVDADDGSIDGQGSAGDSLRSRVVLSQLSDEFFIELQFDWDELGFAPNAVGFAWTDSVPGSSLEITINGDAPLGLGRRRKVASTLGDDSRSGTTSEDRFFGVLTSAAIQTITISGRFSGPLPSAATLEIDHLQYGRASATFLEGDYNGDSRVDQADLDLVLLNWGEEIMYPRFPAGWVNQPPGRLIEQRELDRVLANWGRVATNPGPAMALRGAAVPESATLALAVLGLAAGIVAVRLRPQ